MSVIEPVNQIPSLCLDLSEVLAQQINNLDDVFYRIATEYFMDWNDSCDVAFNAKIIASDDEIADEVQLTLQLKALARGYQTQLWLRNFPKKKVARRIVRKQPTQRKLHEHNPVQFPA
jgi:hypothetical protein